MRDAGSVVRTYTIAVLPGDGIGPEVIAQAERALDAAGERLGIEFTLRRFPLGAAGLPGVAGCVLLGSRVFRVLGLPRVCGLARGALSLPPPAPATPCYMAP